MNRIEPSKSSRAKCRTCNGKIDKGIARLGIETEFEMDGESFMSTKWHHLKCGMEELPDAVITADIIAEVKSRGKVITLSDEEIEKIVKFKKKHSKAGLAIVGISTLDEPNKIINTRGEVLRFMKPSEREDLEGEVKPAVTVYVQDEEQRSKIILWDEHTEINGEKGDEIVVIKGITVLASNDNIQVHATEDSVVLLNPDENELEEHSETIDLYISKAWKRPTGMKAEFTYAPTGRATCVVCGERINKGELKVVKPVFIEIQNGRRTVPGDISFHINCVIKDEHGSEILHEATTRLDQDMINENYDNLSKLKEDLDNKNNAKIILEKLL